MNRNIHYTYIITLLLLLGAATPAFAQTIKGNVYGGGNLSQVVGSTTINIKSGEITTQEEGDGNIYGGGYGTSAVLTGNTTINVTGGTIAKDVYGGGALANVTGSTEVNIDGGTVTQDVYGGGALANVSANTSVNLTGGTIRDSYGGGLGSNEVAALIGGDATTTLNGSIVLGNVFGCNNLNGTPQGHAKVHVLSTAERDGQGDDEYDVAAVYGGGNLAAYEPTNANEFAEVLIENCDNSIEYVYGGGNAAPVPATQVTIMGANAIDNAFAGGNGAGVDNPGADIGYKGFFSSGAATEYGTGIATINVQGGTIHHVYGGSNTLGYIKDHAVVNVNAAGTCPMDVAELYGGGKKAPGKAAQINITCTGETGKIDNVYGGAHMADLTGDITLNINGGNIGNAFGGNNKSGNINGSIHVVVDWTDSTCGKNSLDNVYGGGKDAAYTTPDGKTGPLVELINATINNNVYGGGKGETAKVTSNPIVTLEGATVGTTATIETGIGGRIFGGGDAAPVEGNPTVTATAGSADKIFAGGKGATAVVTGNPTAVLNKTDEKILTLTEIYGGGDAAEVTGNTTVTLTKGTVTNAFGGGNAAAINGATAVTIANATASNVYGGGNLAGVSQTATITMTGGNVTTGLYGGCNSEGSVTGNIAVNVTGGHIGTDAEHKANVHGGGYGSATQTTGNVTVAVNGAGVVVYGDIYGGSALGNTNDDTDDNTRVTIIAGTIHGDVYGGGLGDASNAALVNGNVAVNINGGTVNGSVYGCNNTNGAPKGTVTIDVTDGTISNNVFGGGNLAAATVSPNVNIKGGTVTESVYGGGYGATAVITGNPIVVVSGGTVTESVFGGGSLAETNGATSVTVSENGNVTHDVYGGGALADVSESTTVLISGGTSGDVYGGGLGSAEVAATVGNVSVQVTGGTANNVFGSNNTNGSPKGTVNVEIAGGTINNNVYGGGHLANATANPIVTISDGTVTHDVYGGGALADVTGNTTVNLTGGAVGGAYGGALGQKNGVNGATSDIAAYVNGNTTVTLNGTQITETGVFGCNNLNGTPKGHAYVHVLSTTPRDGFEYDVPAVYGGGNLSAYEPTDANDYAEVLIENCSNSIEYVYGGGNAAPVPATDVKIYGANAINHAFAGGNGAGAGNPGADVGYKGYFSQGHATIYGTGEAKIKVLGGTVHNVYGGSNTLGYIRGGTYVSVDNPEADDPHTSCELNVGKVYGGGNEADIDCDIHMDLDCNEGGQILYAGANNANVHGNIILNIHSGTYGQVFCGNNTGGKIFGKLQVNVDETGCWPVMIGELYACGNLAPYSIRGWHTDGKARTEEQFNALTADEKAAEKFENGEPYDDPEVNLISFTRIGKVFGGGYGESAVLYGNTHVNIDPIPGIYADGSAIPVFILNDNDKRVENTNNSSITDALGVDKIGSIGTIYGGGNKGAVYGNTNVNIGLKTKNKHISGKDTTTEEDVAVTITGNVFGGGNEAIVSGDTNVKIGENN